MAWSVDWDSFQVPRESLWVSYIASFLDLSKARLLSGNVAPLLDNGLLDLPGVGPGPGADLLGHINALLGGLQLGNQLGHMLASPLGLKATLLLGGVLDHGLDLVKALLSLVTCLQVLWGSRLHCSLGASWTTVWTLSKHSSAPSLKPQPAGAQSSLGSLVHPVMGVYFFTGFLDTEQTSL